MTFEYVSMAAAPINAFLSLPENQLGEIIDYLDLTDRRRLVITCKFLLSITPDLDSKIKSLQVRHRDRLALMDRSLLSNLVNLQSLILGKHASDDILWALGSGSNDELVPNLTHISMIQSMNVTDYGIQSLARGESRSKNLRSIDITYCRNTTYFGTFPLRASLCNLEVIRRQPEWIDGRLESPTAQATFWPDGTLLFEHENGSYGGFVCDMWAWDDTKKDPDHVGRKLLYNDFVPPPSWGAWAKYCYRPGVSLLRIPEVAGNSGDREGVVRTVLVAEPVKGLQPPSNFPLIEHRDLMPLGEFRFVNGAGNLLPGNADPMAQMMISFMRVYPLRSLMPSKDVLERNLSFCQQMQNDEHLLFRGSFSILEGEEVLHAMLSE